MLLQDQLLGDGQGDGGEDPRPGRLWLRRAGAGGGGWTAGCAAQPAGGADVKVRPAYQRVPGSAQEPAA